METDWQSGKSLLEANLHLLNNKLLSDITFIFPKPNEDPDVIYSHKFILSKRSSVFCNMFYGSLPVTNEIIIEDISKEYFLIFLKYIYTEIVKITYFNVVELSYLANKYLITKMSAICNEIKINSPIVLIIMEKSMAYSSHAFTNRCMKLISNCTLQTISSESWLHTPKDVIKQILKLNTINCEEIVLFRHVLRWADAYCRQNNVKRDSLQDVFKLIRFSTMSGAEFTECASHTDLFKSQLEIGDIFLYITQANKLDKVSDNDTNEPASKNRKLEDASKEDGSSLKRSKRTIIYKKKIFPILFNDLTCYVRNKRRCEVKVLALKNFNVLGFELMAGAIPKYKVFDDKNVRIAMGSNEMFPKPIYMQQNQTYTFVFDEAAPIFYPNSKIGKIFSSRGSDVFLIVSAKLNLIRELHTEA